MCKLLASRRILVVEDEMMVLIAIESLLAELGCVSVTAAATVEQAIALIDAETFDLAMLDVNLGGTSSYSVADALVSHAVPFLFSTGYTDEDGGWNGYPASPVLHKPYPRMQLTSALTSLLA